MADKTIAGIMKGVSSVKFASSPLAHFKSLHELKLREEASKSVKCYRSGYASFSLLNYSCPNSILLFWRNEGIGQYFGAKAVASMENGSDRHTRYQDRLEDYGILYYPELKLIDNKNKIVTKMDGFIKWVEKFYLWEFKTEADEIFKNNSRLPTYDKQNSLYVGQLLEFRSRKGVDFEIKISDQEHKGYDLEEIRAFLLGDSLELDKAIVWRESASKDQAEYFSFYDAGIYAQHRKSIVSLLDAYVAGELMNMDLTAKCCQKCGLLEKCETEYRNATAEVEEIVEAEIAGLTRGNDFISNFVL